MPPIEISLCEFDGRSLLRFCDHPFDRTHDYYDLYLKLSLPFGREANVAAVLAMMLFENATKAGMPVALVHKFAPDIIFYALAVLASDYNNWHVTRSHPQYSAVIRDLPARLKNVSFVKDTFSFHERRLARYMIMIKNDRILTAASLDEIEHEFGCGAVVLIDANALATDFRARTEASLFNII